MICRRVPLCIALLLALVGDGLTWADELAGKPICTIETEADGESRLLTALLCGGGSRVLVSIRDRTAGSDLIRVHDTATGKQIFEKRLTGESLMDCSISLDGRRVYLAHQSNTGRYTYRIEIIDLPTEKSVYADQASAAIDAAMSPDGNYILRFSTNFRAEPMHRGEARVYRVSDGKEILKATFPDQHLVRLFSPDGKILVLFGERYFKSWDLVGGRPLADLEPVKDISFTRWRFLDRGTKLRSIEGKELIDWDTQSGKIVNRRALRGHTLGELIDDPDVMLADRGGSLAFVSVATGQEIARWNYAANRSARIESIQAGLVIIHGDRYRGDFCVVRIPDFKTLPPIQPIASPATKPAQAVPTTAPSLASATKEELVDSKWWTRAIEMELPLIASDYHRSHVMYELSVLHARLGDLDMALRYLEQADALRQPSTDPTEWQSGKLRAYRLAARLLCEKRGVDAATMLLSRLDEDTRREADWTPETVICEGLAYAGATTAIAERMRNLKGEELNTAAARVIRILGEKGGFADAEKIALLLPDSPLGASVRSSLASTAAFKGDFDLCFRMLPILQRTEAENRGPVTGVFRTIGYQAQKQNRPEVLKKARELAGRDVHEVDWGVAWYFIQSRQLDAARSFIKDRPPEDQVRRDFEQFINVAPIGQSLEKLIEEVMIAKQTAWERLVQRLSAENRLDDIENLLRDQRFTSTTGHDRTRAAMLGLLALYKADRVGQADSLYRSLLPGEQRDTDGVDYARAAAHRRRGDEKPYRELLEKIERGATDQKGFPPEMRQHEKLSLQIQVEDIDAAIRTSREVPVPMAIRSLSSLVLSKGTDEQIRALMPVVENLKDVELSNEAYYSYTSLQKVGKLERYLIAVQAMPHAEKRCVFKLTAAKVNLQVDPAEREHTSME